MSRMIDKDALEEAVQGAINIMELHGISMIAASVPLAIIKGAPTIDAIPVAKYKAEIETLRSRCYPGAEDAFGRKAYGCLKIVPVSYGTKSVDAIPVEWLKRVQRECVADIQQVPMYVAIGWLIDMWQKEQEADIAQKLGIEPKEG